MTKLAVRLIDAEDKLLTVVSLDDRKRVPGKQYQPREIIFKGKRFREPSEDLLSLVSPDEWREVVN